MHRESLDEAIHRAGEPLTLLLNAPPRPHTLPVTAEFSNWRPEQRSWRSSCALLDQLIK